MISLILAKRLHGCHQDDVADLSEEEEEDDKAEDPLEELLDELDLELRLVIPWSSLHSSR